MAKDSSVTATTRRTYWQTQIEQAKKRYRTFHDDGNAVIDAYLLQRSDYDNINNKDKFNILYSSTETMRPNLYAQTPKPMVQPRHRDRQNPLVRAGCMMLQNCLSYVTADEDFDEVMENCVEDYILPGLGQAWVRYEPTFKEVGTKEDPQQELLEEQVRIEYLYWQDFLTGATRGWKALPWGAKRIWATKAKATKYWGPEKANALTYAVRERDRKEENTSEETAEVWEIWDIETKTVYWYCESYAADLLDVKADPLKLRKFFPFPRPLRAIANTRNFVPRALYSQYKSQAETINTMTKRIRLLSEAIKVTGVYNGANEQIANLLAPETGNRLIKVDSWAMFANSGGVKGNIEWLPLEAVVTALIQLQQARELAKNEIYEITGFSDIVRGVSKASETLGAQNIKADWAGARVKKMQREVQRFARDILAIVGEIIAEHCKFDTVALFGGVELPQPDPQTGQPDPQSLQNFNAARGAAELLKKEGFRVANIDIETDSTILANEEAERKDRMEFLGAAGAFLQQAVPAMQTMPQLGALLGAMLMFTVRTFPSSRPIEDVFQQLEDQLANYTPPPQGDNGAGDQAKAQASIQIAQMKIQGDQAKEQSSAQQAAADRDAKMQKDSADLQLKGVEEQNRHEERMIELQLQERELALKERELSIKDAELQIKNTEVGIAQQQADTQAESAAVAAEQGAHEAELAERQQDSSEQAQDHSQYMAEEQHVQRTEQMDRADENARQDRLTKSKTDAKKPK